MGIIDYDASTYHHCNKCGQDIIDYGYLTHLKICKGVKKEMDNGDMFNKLINGDPPEPKTKDDKKGDKNMDKLTLIETMYEIGNEFSKSLSSTTRLKLSREELAVYIKGYQKAMNDAQKTLRKMIANTK